MCRNIKRLFNLDPSATDDEIRASALQYVRKVSGSTRPSNANEEAFDAAVDAISEVTSTLLAALTTHAPKRTREQEAERARVRGERRASA